VLSLFKALVRNDDFVQSPSLTEDMTCILLVDRDASSPLLLLIEDCSMKTPGTGQVERTSVWEELLFAICVVPLEMPTLACLSSDES
jgi:hypothetical protein